MYLPFIFYMHGLIFCRAVGLADVGDGVLDVLHERNRRGNREPSGAFETRDVEDAVPYNPDD